MYYFECNFKLRYTQTPKLSVDISYLVLNRPYTYTNTYLIIICIYILLVPAVLNQLKHPFKLLDAQNLHKLSIDHDIHETITPDKSDHIKLLIQYYPNKKNYDKEKFSE